MTGSVIAQGLATVTGLLLARWMSVEDYALYIIVIMIMGAVGVLTKGGVHLAFTAIMGRVWPDMEKISGAIGSLKIVRRFISIVMLPLILVLSTYMLVKNGAVVFEVILINVFLVVFWWADMQTRVIDQVLFFAHETTKVQILDTLLALLRVALIAAIFVIGELNIITALLASVVVVLFRAPPIVKWVNGHLDSRHYKEDIAYTLEMKGTVKKQMPVEIYDVFKTQFLLFILTIFATSTQIAEYGALTRLMALLAPINAFVYAFCVPIFNKRRGDDGWLLVLLLFLTSVPSFVLIGVGYYFPEALLWLIGENYAHLHHELLIATLVFAFGSVVGVFWNLVAHKGMYFWTALQIPIGVLWALIAVNVLDMSSTTGALIMQAGFSIGVLIVALLGYFDKPKHGES